MRLRALLLLFTAPVFADWQLSTIAPDLSVYALYGGSHELGSIYHFSKDGIWDPRFSVSLEDHLGMEAKIHAMTVGNDGSLYLAGNSPISIELDSPALSGSGENVHFVGKILPGGKWDSSFGAERTGVSLFHASEPDDQVSALVVSNTGQVYVSSAIEKTSKRLDGGEEIVVWKLLPNGRLDSRFNGTGFVEVPFGSIRPLSALSVDVTRLFLSPSEDQVFVAGAAELTKEVPQEKGRGLMNVGAFAFSINNEGMARSLILPMGRELDSLVLKLHWGTGTVLVNLSGTRLVHITPDSSTTRFTPHRFEAGTQSMGSFGLPGRIGFGVERSDHGASRVVSDHEAAFILHPRPEISPRSKEKMFDVSCEIAFLEIR